MLKLTDPHSIAETLKDPDLDPDLHALLHRLASNVGTGDNMTTVVVQGGDTPAVINAGVGFRITGDGAGEPGVDWIEDHGRWFMITLTPSAGRPARIFVENDPGTELGIHYLCLAYFWPNDAEAGR